MTALELNSQSLQHISIIIIILATFKPTNLKRRYYCYFILQNFKQKNRPDLKQSKLEIYFMAPLTKWQPLP